MNAVDRVEGLLLGAIGGGVVALFKKARRRSTSSKKASNLFRVEFERYMHRLFRKPADRSWTFDLRESFLDFVVVDGDGLILVGQAKSLR